MAPVDCVGHWLSCMADCADKAYVVTVPAAGAGASCEAEHGAVARCEPGDGNCPANVACSGSFADCTAACETAAARTWTEIHAQSGTGEACPVASDCMAGEGGCPANHNCAGEWSECTAACETAAARTWTELQAQSGQGMGCPTASDCSHGEGDCHAPPPPPPVPGVDCSGAWSSCGVDCGIREFHVNWPAAGGGLACEAADGERMECAYGEGDCVAPVDCVGHWSTCGIDCHVKMFEVTVPAAGAGASCEAEHGQYAACEYGDGDCVAPVDCEGAWSECEADCSEKVFTITVPAAGTGSECSARDGDRETCAAGEGACPSDIDCEGEWRTCSSRCEVASERVWREVWAPSGAGAACPTATDCEYGEGSCEAPIDCEGSWSVCQEDCGNKRFMISVRASAGGQPCTARDGDTASCTAGEGECPPDHDCEGEWSTCTNACEKATVRVWISTQAQSGRGRECPPATPCLDGDGYCSAPVDCAGHYSPCTADCESAGERVWTETVARSGEAGQPCPLAEDCVGGQGNCEHEFDCQGWWTTCSDDCKRHFAVTQPASGGGQQCEYDDGKQQRCVHGEGLCGSPDTDPPPRPPTLFGLQCDEDGCLSTAIGLLLFFSAFIACLLLLIHRFVLDPGTGGGMGVRRQSLELEDLDMRGVQEKLQADPERFGAHQALRSSSGASFSPLVGDDDEETFGGSGRPAGRSSRSSNSRRSPRRNQAAGARTRTPGGREEANPLMLISAPSGGGGPAGRSRGRSRGRSPGGGDDSQWDVVMPV